jgi:surface antigen
MEGVIMRFVRLESRKLTPVLLMVFLLTACANPPGQKATLGAATGAAAGGLIGAAAGGGTAGIIGGVLLGGLMGGAIGDALDQRDKELAYQQQQSALESSGVGQTSTWQNPDSGNSGTYTPTRTYQNSQGQPCREFQQTIQVAGNSEEGFGTACRQSDGTWKITQ